jgi:hypothetical protein
MRSADTAERPEEGPNDSLTDRMTGLLTLPFLLRVLLWLLHKTVSL